LVPGGVRTRRNGLNSQIKAYGAADRDRLDPMNPEVSQDRFSLCVVERSKATSMSRTTGTIQIVDRGRDPATPRDVERVPA
jgi:hypothetical protein